MLKNKYVAFGLFVVLVMAFWNLLDFLYSLLITHSKYQFGTVRDLLIPLTVAIVTGCLLFLIKKDRDNKS